MTSVYEHQHKDIRRSWKALLVDVRPVVTFRVSVLLLSGTVTVFMECWLAVEVLAAV